SIQFSLPLRELFHGALRVLGRQKKEEDGAHAVQVARGRRLSEVLLRGSPARGVDDGAGSLELVEFLLRRTEVDQHDFPMGVEDDVLGLDVSMDDVPPVKVCKGLKQLQDVSSGGGCIGRLVSES